MRQPRHEEGHGARHCDNLLKKDIEKSLKELSHFDISCFNAEALFLCNRKLRANNAQAHTFLLYVYRKRTFC